MEVVRFEVCREGITVKDTRYEGPLTREEALCYLQVENPQWTGKLTAKGSQVELRGPEKLDPSIIYTLWLPRLAGRKMLHLLSSVCCPGLRSNAKCIMACWTLVVADLALKTFEKTLTLTL